MEQQATQVRDLMEQLDAMWSAWQTDAERQEARSAMAQLMRLQMASDARASMAEWLNQ